MDFDEFSHMVDAVSAEIVVPGRVADVPQTVDRVSPELRAYLMRIGADPAFRAGELAAIAAEISADLGAR